jgi:signal transduction histidine kinase
MKPADPDAGRDDDCRILPMRPIDATCLSELVAAAVASAVDPAACGRLRISQDVDPRLEVPGIGPLLFEAVVHLVADAVAATTGRRPASDFPAVREVVVTAVDTAGTLEIEIADSTADVTGGAGREPLAPAAVAAVARMGGSLTVQPCPDGGRAVTIRLPRRRARGLAA